MSSIFAAFPTANEKISPARSIPKFPQFLCLSLLFSTTDVKVIFPSFSSEPFKSTADFKTMEPPSIANLAVFPKPGAIPSARPSTADMPTSTQSIFLPQLLKKPFPLFKFVNPLLIVWEVISIVAFTAAPISAPINSSPSGSTYFTGLFAQ